MNRQCQHIRDAFSPLLDGELDTETRETVEAHLAECAECLRELHGFKQVVELYARLPLQKAPEELEARIRRAIRPPATVPLDKARRARRMRLWPLAAAALLLLCMGLPLMWSLRQESEPMHLAQSSPAELQAFGAAPAPEDGIREKDLFEAPPLEEPALRAATPPPLAAPPLIADTSAPQPKAAASIPSDTQADTVARLASPETQLDISAPPAPPPPPPAEESAEAKTLQNFGYAESSAASAVYRADDLVKDRLMAADRTFFLTNKVWQQEGYQGEPARPLRVGLQAFERLIAQRPELAELAGLDTEVIFQFEGTWYRLRPARRNSASEDQ